MRPQAVMAGLIAAVFLATVTFKADSPALAETLLQTTPPLNGINIYFTEAQDEASRFDRSTDGLSRFAGLLQQLGANLFTLEWRTGFPMDADLIVIAGPRQDFSPDQEARLWSYMNNNGRVLMLADAFVTTGRGGGGVLALNSGIFELMWADLGLRARDEVIVTEIVQEITEPAPDGSEEAPTTTETGTLAADLITTNIATAHPVVNGLAQGLAFFEARPLEVDASPQRFTATPLVFTDTRFYGETDYGTFLNTGEYNFDIGIDLAPGALTLAAALENPDSGVRIVLVGDREFATNGSGLASSPPSSGSFIYPDNVRFLLNAVTWLVDTEALDPTFATPAPTATATITPSPTPTNTPTTEPTPTPAEAS
ncbi:MAG: hypothetical protein GYB67_10590 [Chloroflexi bacterium]|nr:hypothetical protein [Chloroflexota bacterium]